MANKESVVFSINWNACINCGACVSVCPLEESFISSFDTIAVDEECHIACMACEKICPVTAIDHQQTGISGTRKSVYARSSNKL